MRLLSVVVAALLLAACKPSAPEGAATTPSTVPAPASATAAAAKVGEVVALKLPALDGSSYDLAAQRGQWVLVNLWATWCGPCLEEMPELSAMDAMRDHISVVGLAYDDISADEMKAFLQKHPVTYPIVMVDPADPPAVFENPRGLPMSYLIAPDGKLVKTFLGPVTAKIIEGEIAAAGGPKTVTP